MKAIVRMNKWANAHTTIGLDILRIGFGIFLFWKGMHFVGQTKELSHILSPDGSAPISMLLAHYIAMSHFAGGLLVSVGLLTRLALAFQLPILIGALVVNFSGAMDTWETTQAVLAFATACFFIVIGSGKHSVDYTLKMGV